MSVRVFHFWYSILDLASKSEGVLAMTNGL
jgi:hypothetical protein